MRVDVHAHYLPPPFFDLMDEAGARDTLESYSVFGPMIRGGAERLYPAATDAVIDNWIDGVDRLVLGSDLPRGPLADIVDFVASSPLLSEDEKTNILDVHWADALNLSRTTDGTGARP